MTRVFVPRFRYNTNGCAPSRVGLYLSGSRPVIAISSILGPVAFSLGLLALKFFAIYTVLRLLGKPIPCVRNISSHFNPSCTRLCISWTDHALEESCSPRLGHAGIRPSPSRFDLVSTISFITWLSVDCAESCTSRSNAIVAELRATRSSNVRPGPCTYRFDGARTQFCLAKFCASCNGPCSYELSATGARSRTLELCAFHIGPWTY